MSFRHVRIIVVTTEGRFQDDAQAVQCAACGFIYLGATHEVVKGFHRCNDVQEYTTSKGHKARGETTFRPIDRDLVPDTEPTKNNSSRLAPLRSRKRDDR